MTEAISKPKSDVHRLKNEFRAMHVKSDYCRLQEAHQQHLADHDPLESCRLMGAAGAKAWRLEAVKSEKREAAMTGPLGNLFGRSHVNSFIKQ